jgi:hypothetical protein
MELTLKQYPVSSSNNARSIVRKELEKMRDFPSEQQAQKLELMFGIVCDFKDEDLGNEPY